MLTRFILLPRRFFYSSSPIQPPNSLESIVLAQFRGGRFHDLLTTAVLHPSVLAAAAASLASRSLSSPSAFPSFSDFLDIPSHGVKILPSRLKGQPLVLPDLHLKVLIEAIRSVLEVVYDSRFATFVYGGRDGVGRHTALRYLKSSVQNPSWWFRPALLRQPFDGRHISRLKAVISEKIDDPALVSLVESLFEFEVIGFHLGGTDLGRGLPQDSGLNSILLNIYFEALDREIQEIRSEIHKENPRLKDPSLEGNARVFHKPVRLYAVRYLDEILVITSGSKMLTMSIKDRILKCLEGELGLKVDKYNSSIHSAVNEKMEFMGFELQAVPPSVLHPPMSEKAIRARKKFLKRKAVKAQELKNARETIRKKLGLKILNHCFKKLKKCHEGFRFDFRIENELREIFGGWAEEVMAEFLKNREDCWSWHHMLTSGDFLTLRGVRDQLPQELVDAYDQFQETVDKYLMPVEPSKVIGEEERQEEDEEKKYAKRTIEDLAELRMRVNTPMELVKKAVKLAGFTNSMGRPRPIKLLICLDDSDIIKWYAGVGRRWLNFFCCCRNFKMVKTVVNYHLRFSCFLTLAEKHESTKREAIKHYKKDLNVIDSNGVGEIHFPTEREIKMMGDKNLADPKPVDSALGLILARLAFNETKCCCVVHFCDRMDTTLYRIRLLQNRLNVNPMDEDKWVPGMGAIHECLNKKCLPLCSKHASDLLLGNISLQDVDCTSFVNM